MPVRFLATVGLTIALTGHSITWALPIDGHVAGGSAAVTRPTPDTLHIQQTSERALLHWRDFSIGSTETVRFEQPSASALAINRVLGPEPSVLLGRLLANGRVFLLNPNGVVIYQGATINAAGFLAGAFSLDDPELQAGRARLGQAPDHAPGAVLNQGTIRIDERGFVILAGSGVVNEGLIVAKLGTVGLLASEQVTVDFGGDGLIQYAVNGAVRDAVTDPRGQTLAAAVTQAGRIEADGGRVLLSGSAAEAVVASVVNHTGVTRAQRLINDGGEIVLQGGARGAVEVAGTLHATGAGGAGGTVRVSGDVAWVTGTPGPSPGEAERPA